MSRLTVGGEPDVAFSDVPCVLMTRSFVGLTKRVVRIRPDGGGGLRGTMRRRRCARLGYTYEMRPREIHVHSVLAATVTLYACRERASPPRLRKWPSASPRWPPL